MWTRPHKLIKTGFKHLFDTLKRQAGLKQIIVYETGSHVCFKLTEWSIETNSYHHSFFKTFEEVILYIDINDLSVDSYGWDKYGIPQLYANPNTTYLTVTGEEIIP